MRESSGIERTCYLLAAVLMLSGLVHLVILVVTGGPWNGPVSWRKPMSFGLSFGLTLATLTWALGFVTLGSRTRGVLLAVLAAASVVEVVVITVQTWRGLPSHFGVTGAGAELVAVGAAGGALAIVAVVASATVATWRPAPATAPSMLLALRAGFGSLMVAVALGVYMLARGMIVSRGGGDVDGAFAFTATIKPGHAATMHGVLALPALARVASFADRRNASGSPWSVPATPILKIKTGEVNTMGVPRVRNPHHGHLNRVDHPLDPSDNGRRAALSRPGRPPARPG